MGLSLTKNRQKEKRSFNSFFNTFLLLDRAWVCMTFGRKLTASSELLVDHRNLVSLFFFYIYYFGRRSSELAELFPLTYSCVRSVDYSHRLHDFSSNITRCYKDVYTSSSSHRTATPFNSCLQNYFLWIMI